MNRKFKHRFLLPAILFVVGIISACATDDKIYDSQVISVTRGKFVLPKNAKVAFHQNTLVRRSDTQYLRDIREEVREEIQAQLQASGLIFDSPENADYLIAATYILGEALTNEQIAARFGMRPTLVPPTRKYELGTLVMGLSKKSDTEFIWRGSVQTTAATANQPEQILQSQRQQAIERLVRRMVRDIALAEEDAEEDTVN